MKWTAIFLSLLLTACSSSTSDSKHYYQLLTGDVNKTLASGVIQTQPRFLTVEAIKVDDFLTGQGIVYQVNDVQYVMAQQNQWGSSLDQQLQQALMDNLRVRLSADGWIIASQQIGAAEPYTLNVTVTGFHGRHDGMAVVQGSWILTYGQRVVSQPFSFIKPQDEDGYTGLVRALSESWAMESDVIADTLKKIE